MIVVDLLLAIICFGTPQVCHPALVGRDTPKGEYTTTLRLTDQPGYGGDVIQFHETAEYVFAIHRVWLLNPKQKRDQRLLGSVSGRTITGGCVNVSPEVYKSLKNCCLHQQVLVK